MFVDTKGNEFKNRTASVRFYLSQGLDSDGIVKVTGLQKFYVNSITKSELKKKPKHVIIERDDDGLDNILSSTAEEDAIIAQAIIGDVPSDVFRDMSKAGLIKD